MKRTGYECDRCKVISETPGTEYSLPKEWRRICVFGAEEGTAHKQEWHLCPECGPALSVWVEDFKRRQKELAASAPSYLTGAR
jgi:hypothetical protein